MKTYTITRRDGSTVSAPTAGKLAELLGIKKRTVFSYVCTGKVKVEGIHEVPEEDFDEEWSKATGYLRDNIQELARVRHNIGMPECYRWK